MRKVGDGGVELTSTDNGARAQRWEGANSLGWEAALGSGEALRPAHGEKGGVRWLGTDGVLESRGECGGDGLLEADTVLARMRH
jgi:hypothetical protein